ncbi:MAG: energy-coupling factor ABC transporter ATP-binding protein [Synergistaceae bacterium]|nr:energy-coupling factor ABC transporter ATP-binding protein [Synergistaceae bacterium]
MLEVKNLYYTYSDNHEALKNVSFAINDGEKIALVGANGSGKSTLLLHLAGAVEVQRGKIFINGDSKIETLRKKVGLIFQDSDNQLLMPSVIEDVAFNLVANGVKANKAHELAEKILNSLGVSHLASRPPHKLSGGEKKIITIAGTIISQPEILALDEPTSGLDPKARRRVINFLRGYDKTILLATHDLDMALDICSRAIILYNGEIVITGTLPELFTNQQILERYGLELPLRYS